MLDTLRALRTSALLWAVAGGVAMYGMGMAIAAELSEFPGGPRALAASVEAGAQALRILRWPAERLDTLGGYVTYHNVILVNLFLAIYASLQGVKAIRGAEERHALELVLAAGASRLRVVRDRAIGFAVALAVICLGLGLGVAAGLAGGGAPDLAGSLLTLLASGCAASVGYGLGLLISQLTPGARGAAGGGAVVVVGMYVLTNLGGRLGSLEFLTYLSPFTYANYSRALVPGHAFDPLASLGLLAAAAALTGVAGWAFRRRDYAAPLWAGRPWAGPARGGRRPARTRRVPTALLSSIWTAWLRGRWVGLLGWALGAAATTGLLARLQPAVMEVWSEFEFIGSVSGAAAGASAEATYWSFTGALVSPLVASYVVTQASGWVADLAQGRVELLLAGPVSWTRLVLGRLVALVVGVGVITAAALAALAAGATSVGSGVEAPGALRLASMSVLFGAAFGALAAVLVAWLRRGAAVTALAVVVAASYVLAYLVPLLHWPAWLNRLSVFWAFGTPYLDPPTTTQLAVLLTLAIPGAVLAAVVAERSPRVA